MSLDGFHEKFGQKLNAGTYLCFWLTTWSTQPLFIPQGANCNYGQPQELILHLPANLFWSVLILVFISIFLK